MRGRASSARSILIRRTASNEISARSLKSAIDELAMPASVELLQRFFKTGPGEYGEGDQFIGVKMPGIRAAGEPFRGMPADEIADVLQSPIHEHRMAALVILSEQAKAAKKRGDTAQHKRLFDFYLAHTDRINNWDLVDVSCRDVVGEYLLTKQTD